MKKFSLLCIAILGVTFSIDELDGRQYYDDNTFSFRGILTDIATNSETATADVSLQKLPVSGEIISVSVKKQDTDPANALVDASADVLALTGDLKSGGNTTKLQIATEYMVNDAESLLQIEVQSGATNLAFNSDGVLANSDWTLSADNKKITTSKLVKSNLHTPKTSKIGLFDPGATSDVSIGGTTAGDDITAAATGLTEYIEIVGQSGLNYSDFKDSSHADIDQKVKLVITLVGGA